MDEEELIRKAQHLIQRWDNLRIVGSRGEWSGNARQRFMFNPKRGGGSTGGGPPPGDCPPPNPCTVDISWTLHVDDAPPDSSCSGPTVDFDFSDGVVNKDLEPAQCNSRDADGFFSLCWTASATPPNCNVFFGHQIPFFNDVPISNVNNINASLNLLYANADDFSPGSPAGYYIGGSIEYVIPCSPFSTEHRKACDDWQGNPPYFGFLYLGADLSVFGVDVGFYWDLYSDDTCSVITGTLGGTFHPC